MKHLLEKVGCRVHGCSLDKGLVALRLALAIPFLYAGWFKLTNAAMVDGFITQAGLPHGFGTFLGLVEVIIGAMMLLGVWVQIAGGIMLVIMVAAVYLMTGKMGFAAGWQLNLILGLGAIAMMKMGAGMYSLDAKWGKCSCAMDDDGCCGGGCCGEGEAMAMGGCGEGGCGCDDEADLEAMRGDEGHEHVVVVEDGKVVAVAEADDEA